MKAEYLITGSSLVAAAIYLLCAFAAKLRQLRARNTAVLDGITFVSFLCLWFCAVAWITTAVTH